jgi:hypothetical protein
MTIRLERQARLVELNPVFELGACVEPSELAIVSNA